MLEQNLPVLIFAQSGRFLAQSATQAGYTVWVADCFGDQDTLDVADRWKKIAPIKESNQRSILHTLIELASGQMCHLVCGAGIESNYSFLKKLPNNIQLIGNVFSTIETIKTPRLFFDLLQQLKIAYPPTRLSPPNNTNNWLAKSASGLGGQHIQYLTSGLEYSNHYFQSHISGHSGAGLFLANGQQAILLSINQQKSSPDNPSSFTLCSIEAPWIISEKHQQQLEQIIDKITVKTHLVGLNSVDFIISDKNELLVLEINPRPSASAELAHTELPVIQHHFIACQQRILPRKTVRQSSMKSSLRYIFATKDISIPSNMIWPENCHDRPTAGTIIKENEPICTSIVQASNLQQVGQKHDLIETKINGKLLSNS